MKKAINLVGKPIVHAKFGKGKVGVALAGNAETHNPVILLDELKEKGKVGRPPKNSSTQPNSIGIALEFANVESLNVLIDALHGAKEMLHQQELDALNAKYR